VDWATADDRIRLCKGIVTDTNQQMDPERLRVLKAVYEENLGEEPVLIRAKLLERLLLTKKLFLDENPVVGTLTSIRCGLYAYPEWSCDWIKDEMDMAKICSLGEIVIPDDTKELASTSSGRAIPSAIPPTPTTRACTAWIPGPTSIPACSMTS